MGLFEQQFSDEQVAAARRKIAAGASLRAAATELGCAPSTLSVRIKKAEAAEAAARIRLGIGERERPLAARTHPDSEPPPISAHDGALAAEAGPIEVLRGALQATKANGQPDWPIRISAARALAALRPEEAEPEPEPEPDPETVIYDLPPGSSPILHHAPPPLLAPVSGPEPPAEPLPEPGTYILHRGDRMILLVKHTLTGDEAPVRFLHSHEAAADILRAFGGNPDYLDTIPDTDPQPDTP
jgi:DNA-binding Lrp family transcriptional regulator